MKFSEVIKVLEANPTRKFEASHCGYRNEITIGETHYYQFKAFNEDGEEIDSHIGSGGFHDNVRTDDDWQEIKQPVTWQEAIQAWANGKTISCTLNKFNYKYDGRAIFLETDSEANFDRIQPSKLQINKGKWYIEGEE